MILNNSQAKAVYNAMCELNNVNGKIKATFEQTSVDTFTNVFEKEQGTVIVNKVVKFTIVEREVFTNQAEFQTAYGV
jgi:hypothetical protein